MNYKNVTKGNGRVKQNSAQISMVGDCHLHVENGVN